MLCLSLTRQIPFHFAHCPSECVFCVRWRIIFRFHSKFVPRSPNYCLFTNLPSKRSRSHRALHTDAIRMLYNKHRAYIRPVECDVKVHSNVRFVSVIRACRVCLAFFLCYYSKHPTQTEGKKHMLNHFVDRCKVMAPKMMSAWGLSRGIPTARASAKNDIAFNRNGLWGNCAATRSSVDEFVVFSVPMFAQIFRYALIFGFDVGHDDSIRSDAFFAKQNSNEMRVYSPKIRTGRHRCILNLDSHHGSTAW